LKIIVQLPGLEYLFIIVLSSPDKSYRHDTYGIFLETTVSHGKQYFISICYY